MAPSSGTRQCQFTEASTPGFGFRDPKPRTQVLGFRVWGVGFGVWSFEFRGLGVFEFRAQGLGRVFLRNCLGFR